MEPNAARNDARGDAGRWIDGIRSERNQIDVLARAAPSYLERVVAGSRHRKGWGGLTALSLASILLAGCQAVPDTAMRIRGDGTVDFVSCDAASPIIPIDARATSGNGASASVEVKLIPPDGVNHIEAGRPITFTGVPADWERIDIYPVHAFDDVPGVYGYLARPKDLDPDRWYWMDDGQLLGPGKHCEIVETE